MTVTGTDPLVVPCVGQTDVMYPVSDSDVEAGKALCAVCPRRRDCLEESLNNREQHGTWGGVSEWERRELLKRHRTGRWAR